MIIRLAKKEDIDNLLKLYRQLDDYHRENTADTYKYISEEFRTNQFTDRLQNPESCIFVVAEIDGKIVGLADAKIEEIKDDPVKIDKKYMLIDNLVVDQNYRRQGIAQRMLEYLEDKAKEQKLDYLTLGVYEFNDAKEFYSKVGFYTVTRKMKKDLK